ncbi:MAG TPA: flagellar filament capping protein FliD, partial [Marmoricola sp.]|nr:flagellar filament capping protein FliD [Marmoricola sp.]
ATASTSLNATSGSLTFNVTSLASKQSTTLPVTTFVDGDNDGKLDTTPTPITGATSITVTPGSYDENGYFNASGDPKTVDISQDQSASGIAKALNAAGAGVAAFVMNTGPGEGVLQITSSKSGAGNGFQIDGLDGTGLGAASPATTPATSATLQMTGGGGTTYAVNSDTNTFTGLMAGVTITVSKLEDNVTVDANSDVGAVANSFKAVVDAANAALTEIGNQTAYDPSTKTGSPLTGDFAVRNMSQTILSSISLGLSYPNDKFDPNQPESGTNPKNINFGSLKKFGIELSDSGTLTFDQNAFTDAYNNDPAGIQKAGMALGSQFKATADTMNTSLTSVITGRNSDIDSLNDQISDWDVRLSDKRQALQKQYSDLEVALGKLKDQSNWLQGQLAGLS